MQHWQSVCSLGGFELSICESHAVHHDVDIGMHTLLLHLPVACFKFMIVERSRVLMVLRMVAFAEDLQCTDV